MNRFLATGAVALAGLMVASGSASAIEMSPALKKIVAAAEKEGQIEIMMAESPFGGSRAVQRFQDGINKMFGTHIKVRWTPGPPYAAMGAKVLTEKQAGQPSSTDVYLATAVQFAPLLKAGLFRKVPWAELYPERVKPAQVEGDSTMLRIYTSLPGVLYNVSMKAMVEKTETLEDFLKPEWKGKFATTPYLAGFDVMNSESHWGAERTHDYVKKLAKQVGWLYSCGGPDRIASGEIPVLVLDCSGSDPNEPRFKGVLGLHVLRDSAQRRYGYVGVPVNAAHPNIATLYTLYMASPEGQKQEWELCGYDLSDYPESHRGATIEALVKKGYKFQDVTLDWWYSQPQITKLHVRNIKMLQANVSR